MDFKKPPLGPTSRRESPLKGISGASSGALIHQMRVHFEGHERRQALLRVADSTAPKPHETPVRVLRERKHSLSGAHHEADAASLFRARTAGTLSAGELAQALAQRVRPEESASSSPDWTVLTALTDLIARQHESLSLRDLVTLAEALTARSLIGAGDPGQRTRVLADTLLSPLYAHLGPLPLAALVLGIQRACAASGGPAGAAACGLAQHVRAAARQLDADVHAGLVCAIELGLERPGLEPLTSFTPLIAGSPVETKAGPKAGRRVPALRANTTWPSYRLGAMMARRPTALLAPSQALTMRQMLLVDTAHQLIALQAPERLGKELDRLVTQPQSPARDLMLLSLLLFGQVHAGAGVWNAERLPPHLVDSLREMHLLQVVQWCDSEADTLSQQTLVREQMQTRAIEQQVVTQVKAAVLQPRRAQPVPADLAALVHTLDPEDSEAFQVGLARMGAATRDPYLPELGHALDRDELRAFDKAVGELQQSAQAPLRRELQQALMAGERQAFQRAVERMMGFFVCFEQGAWVEEPQAGRLTPVPADHRAFVARHAQWLQARVEACAQARQHPTGRAPQGGYYLEDVARQTASQLEIRLRETAA